MHQLLAFGLIMLRAPAVTAMCAVLALLTANCHDPLPRPAPSPVPEVWAPPPEVAPHPAVSAPATEVATFMPRAEPPEVASPPSAASPCDPLPIDSYGVRQSSPRVYVAARSYFLAHTAPGSPHALGPELARERPTLRFSNANRRETGDVMQATIDELTTRYPDSVVVPTTRPLRTDACYVTHQRSRDDGPSEAVHARVRGGREWGSDERLMTRRTRAAA